MNNDEAKFRLRAYRPGGQDAGDATLGEALAHAERDPTLRAWLAREQAFDAAVSAQLRAVTPPAGLREAILAGARAETPGARWRQPVWWAAAAMFAVLIVSTVVWRQLHRPDLGDAFARFAADDMEHGRHGGRGAASGALQALLARPDTRLAGALPIDFANLANSGCRTLRFAGRDVLEICFARNGTEFHLYIAPRGELAGSAEPRAVALGRANAVTWGDARFVYALVGESSADSIRRLL